MITKWLWRIILICLFLRPFVDGLTFKSSDIILSGILFLSSCLYLLKNPVKLKFFDGIILIFILSLLSSIALSQNPLNSLTVLYKYLSLIILVYIVRACGTEERKQLIIILLISGLLVSLYSLYAFFIMSKSTLEYLSEHNINYPFAVEFLARKRAFYPFVLPNLIASYVLMIIMLCLGIIVQRIKHYKKDFLFFLSIPCLFFASLVLFHTKSIGGWLTAILSIFLFLVLGRMLNKKTLIVLLILFIGFSGILYMRMQGDKDFVKPTVSVSRRISYWKETASIIGKHPLTGVGIGNFSLTPARFAHNSYLQIWAEIGLLGILSWFGIIFLFMREGFKDLFSKDPNYYRLGIVLSGMSFLFFNLIDFSFFISQTAFFWWINLGLTTNHKE